MGFIQAAAERMKLSPTKAEARLLGALAPLGFLRQWPIAVPRLKHPERVDYLILDFFHEKWRLAVEVDGGVHARQRGRDRRRDTRLATLGIRTLRVTNREVERDLDAVVARITIEGNV